MCGEASAPVVARPLTRTPVNYKCGTRTPKGPGKSLGTELGSGEVNRTAGKVVSVLSVNALCKHALTDTEPPRFLLLSEL